MPSVEESVYLAKLAEQAERYESVYTPEGLKDHMLMHGRNG